MDGLGFLEFLFGVRTRRRIGMGGICYYVVIVAKTTLDVGTLQGKGQGSEVWLVTCWIWKVHG